ncbi:NADH-quinone oxidoreductase subunit C [Streptomyces sp. NPDC058700]|uniref:NADH-quinone oxidoreductase subunit C n=1 Tax=Streptomyces sp. NPDC058700 TaxID=3346607 RepID=UPI0036548FAB
MTAYDTLPDSVTDVFGEEATAERAYDLLTVDVPPASWIAALTTARDALGCTYFDWLSAVDEPGTGFRVCAHVVALAEGRPRRLLLRTTVPHSAPALPTAIGVYAGAGWHERETHEMFGVDFTGHPHLVPLLLPENFEGHPLRKDFVLAARVAKAWPGAKEPGESHDGGGPKRRQMLPPGVPDPNEWGPLKGQLPPAPTRPARATGDRPARAATGDRPVRRTRSVGEGSASQTPAPDAPTAPPTPRRTRSAPEGSTSRPPTPEAPPEPGTPDAGTLTNRPTPEPGTPDAGASASRPPAAADAASEPGTPGAGAPATRPTPEPGTTRAEAPASRPTPEPATPGAGAPASRPRRSRSASDGSASQSPAAADAAAEPSAGPARSRTRSSDAPWHHARPAFDEEPRTPEPEPTAKPTPEPTAAPTPETPAGPTAGPTPEPPEAPAEPDTRPTPDTPDTPDEPGPGPQAEEPASEPAEPDDPPAPRGPAPHGPAPQGNGTEPTTPAGGDPA